MRSNGNKNKQREDRLGCRMGWAWASTNPIGFVSPFAGTFICSPDCYEGLHLNKACLIPLPTVTSCEPDTSTSKNEDDVHNDDANDKPSPESLPT